VGFVDVDVDGGRVGILGYPLGARVGGPGVPLWDSMGDGGVWLSCPCCLLV
jgi:hypothetical protein